MNKIIQLLKKRWFYLLPILLLFIFIASMWNTNYHIGGDNVMPLNPQNNMLKSLFLWEQENRGVSVWRYTFILWQMPFYLLSLIGIPSFLGIKIFITFNLIIGFVFTYLFYRTIFRDTKFNNNELAVFCAIMFTLSASQLLALITTVYLSCLPLGSYLVIKYLDTKKIKYIFFFALTMSIAYFAQFPQAKYLFIFLAQLFFVLLLYLHIRNVGIKKIIIPLISLFFFTFLLNAFILLPFFFEAFKTNGTYSYYSKYVTVYNGDADLHSAALPFIMRFFNSNLINDVSTLGRYLGKPIFSIWTFFLLMLTLVPSFFAKERREKRAIYILLLGMVAFIFLAKGSNPPFGEIYKFLLFHFPPFKVLRTTATLTIGGTLFFAALVTIAMYYLKQKWQKIFLFIVIIHIIIFHSIFLGYKLITFEDKDKIERGFAIPMEYFQMGEKLDKINEDTKILSLPLDEMYSYKDWQNYIGVSIMKWITRKPFIHAGVAGFSGFGDNLVLQRMNTEEACFWTAINNIGYILNEKDSRIPDYSLSKFNFSALKVLENSYFKLEKVKPECFVPHIYAATDTFLFEGNNNSIQDISRFIKNKQDIVINLESSINKKNIYTTSQIIIEARPDEISKLSDNVITKKVFSDFSSLDSLDFWTYSFTVPVGGNYQMVIDEKGNMMKESKVLKKGNNTIKIPINKSANLIDFDLFISSTSATPLSQIIKKWEGDTIYLISLKYKADEKGSLVLNIDERQRRYPGRNPYVDLNATVLSKELYHKSPGVYEYHAILRTDKNAQESTVTIRKVAGLVNIESIVIEKVFDQKVFFTKILDKKNYPPNIVSKKINPTQYIVDVKNTNAPFHLVFSESFSPDWKVYIQQCKKSCNIFEEWRLRPISEDQHIVVNGFANGWNITLKDSNGRTSYRIILEYWPQRLYLIGAIISLFTFILGMIQLTLKMRRSP